MTQREYLLLLLVFLVFLYIWYCETGQEQQRHYQVARYDQDSYQLGANNSKGGQIEQQTPQTPPQTQPQTQSQPQPQPQMSNATLSGNRSSLPTPIPSSVRSTPSPMTSFSDTSRWINTPPGQLLTYVKEKVSSAMSASQVNIPTAINIVPFVGPYGVTTGNPIDDTPLIFTINDVISLWSKSSGKYLCLVPVEKAITGQDVTDEYDLVLQATANDPTEDKSAQWIIKQGNNQSQFPNSVRLNNVAYPHVFLKGYRYNNDGATKMIGTPTAGWQPGLGKTPQSNLYAEMVEHIAPETTDINSIVIFSSLMSANTKERLSTKSNVYLAANANGTMLNPTNVHTLDEISWERHNIGRQTIHGNIVYAHTNPQQLQSAARIPFSS